MNGLSPGKLQSRLPSVGCRNRRLGGFDGPFRYPHWSGSDYLLDSAHRFLCASPIRFRAAALNLRFRFDGSGAAAGSVRPAFNISLISAI